MSTLSLPRLPGIALDGRALAWRIAPWLLPLSLYALWHLGAAQGWISPQVLPPPSYVWDTLRDLAASGDLWLNLRASMMRVIIGFACGSLLGLVLGAAMGLWRPLQAYLLPSFNALVQIPVLAWLPFVLLLVGIGEPLKYILIAKAALVPVTLNTLQGFRLASPALREVARVYGYTRRQEVLEVILPLATPTIFTGLRLGFTKAWLSLVVVELVASSEGLGYLIVYGRQLFQLDLVMAAVIVVGAVATPSTVCSTGARPASSAGAARPLSREKKHERAATAAGRRKPPPLARPGAAGGRPPRLVGRLASRRGQLRPAGLAGQGAADGRRPSPLRQALARLGASLAREFTGFVIGATAGLLLGALLGVSRAFNRLVGPSFNTFKQISLFAWIPLISVWFGLGDTAKVVFLSLAALVPVVVNTCDGIRGTPPALLEVARVYGYTRLQTFTHVVLPAATPAIFTGIYLA